MRLKVEWKKTWQGYHAWECHYGNVVSQSTVSATKCLKMLLRRLKSLGVDTSHIEPIPEIIEKEGIKND